MFRIKKSSRKGFTLLETLLSVAILLVVTLIAYEGFMSTLNYAGDTALAERVSNDNANAALTKVSNVTNGTALISDDKSTGLLVTGTDFFGVYQVEVFKENAGLSHFSPTSLMQDANFAKTADRSGFAYVNRGCGKDGHEDCEVVYFEVTVNGSKKIKAQCSHKDADGNYDCDYVRYF